MQATFKQFQEMSIDVKKWRGTKSQQIYEYIIHSFIFDYRMNVIESKSIHLKIKKSVMTVFNP